MTNRPTSEATDGAWKGGGNLATFDSEFDFAPFIELQGEKAWAFRKALLFDRIGVFYSLIPKNACTSILSALAQANGLTSKWFQSRNRIHNLQPKFWAFQDLERFHDRTFKIVALREPFRRAASAINNKLVGTDAEHLVHQRFFENHLRKKIHECRLSEIFRLADTLPHWMVDEHFAPQWSFLFYDRYDLLINADHRLETIGIGDREIGIGQHNKKAASYSAEEIGDATIADMRQFVREKGMPPSLTGLRKVFVNSTRPGGNYDRANRLWEALQQAT
jgi:hypothetical protein